jgi:hypothetical protein
LRILGFLFVKSYLACLVDWERNLLRVFNYPGPLIRVSFEPLEHGGHSSAKLEYELVASLHKLIVNLIARQAF